MKKNTLLRAGQYPPEEIADLSELNSNGCSALFLARQFNHPRNCPVIDLFVFSF